MKRRLPLFVVLAVGLVSAAALSGKMLPALAQQGFGTPANAADAGVKLGAKIAAFTLPDASGKPRTVGNWDGSKATVLIYVATRCPVSNAYNERMAAIADTYGPKGVRVFGINSNKAETLSEIAEHAKANKLDFPILKDQGHVIADRFGAECTPQVYVVNAAGTLVYTGQVDDNQNASQVHHSGLKDALNNIIAGQPVAVSETRAFGCSIKR